MVNPQLRESDPALAEVVDHLEERFGKKFDFSDRADQSTFAEGLHELGGHLATNSTEGAINFSVGSNGIVQITVTVKPK